MAAAAVIARPLNANVRLQMRFRDVLAIFVGIGSAMLCVDGGFALYGLEAASHLSAQDREQFRWIAEARPLLAAIFVEGLFGIAGIVLCVGLVKARFWALAALPWVAGALAVLAIGVLIAMPHTWHHQIPIAVVCVIVIAAQRYVQRGSPSAT